MPGSQHRQDSAGSAMRETWQVLRVAAIRAGKVAVSDRVQHHAVQSMRDET
ncbi:MULTISPECIES: hypothetical protein [Stenotrophomonas]|jgi:hypothetical protein|uniref:hypothetical protein n=1 Tax=Stenotrophomonas TaxID=40323 RepID=UPI0018D4D34F|nr:MULTISPECIES: hypothetical protein [Stenotrophomonas]MBH1461516.1 hypothetical protein [Stenotrophomonas maltophilia]MDH0187021.1 hypothetical protein [Stenotrophomonas sp. GD04051]MDH0465883.1 hypothetical protein [Stenotrophomonas sp. GD03993]MDH0876557.1 hypothetical protein [Stenotrophomonas sp. GD03877]MDH2155466.1 hypothetical protein [Stenotrophomonas sp. GD03657]